MSGHPAFERRGLVEGFFGPPWSMSHRAAILEFGAARGMNAYLYAPKDDPYHRELWQEPYPEKEWGELLRLIGHAQRQRIDFVYGFHPGKGLLFSAQAPVETLLTKAERFHQAGVRTFAVLFDDIPSRLEHEQDKIEFDGSLAAAEALWVKKILTRQPARWSDVEWWVCPSYYTDDPLLSRTFGAFEPFFLETLAEHLPEGIPCFWTGPAVVSKKITLAHVKKMVRKLKHPLILWDNYPVNDLAMSREMHLGPLRGRDPRLPEAVYGYLNNPLLQESLSFIPLASCFDYALDPASYDPEQSWKKIIIDRFGASSLPHWRAMRDFCERLQKDKDRPLSLPPKKRSALQAAYGYLIENGGEPWAQEFRPWREMMEKSLEQK